LKTGLLLIAVFFAACSASWSESVKDSLNNKYKGQVLALRTPFSQDKMTFDSAGQPLHAPPSGPWLAYGGLHVEKLELSKETLRLEGHRVGFTGQQKNNQEVLINLGNGVNVEIRLDHPIQSADDAYPVLNRVFFLDADSANLAKPELRRADYVISSERVYHIGDAETKPPRATYFPQPDFTDSARKAKFQGTVGLTIVVDKTGNVARIRLDKALGYGLDENAIEKAKMWRFTPATHNGEPVALETSTEINFSLY
jgi:TonB family protein